MATDYQAIMAAVIRGVSWSKITADFHCSRSTIDKASRVVRDHHFGIADVEQLTDQQLRELFPDRRVRDDAQFLQPDFQKIADRKARGEKVTLLVQYNRYRSLPVAVGQQHYSYKQFCKLFARFVDVNALTARLEHAPGEEMYVDWSGEVMKVVDPVSHHQFKAYVFVASLLRTGKMKRRGDVCEAFR